MERLKMVNSLPPQNLMVFPSETAYSFPPHRRRPLRSCTYGALIQILSHCHTSYSQPKLSEPVSQEDGSITHSNPNSTDVLVPLPNSKGSNDKIVQEGSNGESKENTGLPDGDFDDQATILKLHHIDSVTDGQQEICSSNGISFDDFLVAENRTSDCAIQNSTEQENVNGVLDIQVDDFEVDKEFCIGNSNESLEACFSVDMDVESSKKGDNQDKCVVLENILKDAENELKLNEMELEKLLHNSGGVESSFDLIAEEMEEGEISGEAGVAGESFDALSNDAMSLGEATKKKMRSSEDHFDCEKVYQVDEDRGYLQHETSDSLVDTVKSDSNFMKMESRIPAKQMKDCFSLSVLNDSSLETQRGGAITPCLENPIPSGRILQENAAENQISFTTEKDASNKRKRGPGNQEKRERKKNKKRLKRAETNRKLGVKRLKLQPVLKPKTIVYCRHYLQGRCHEGDKCKFSHDTIPLTKSKPCSHFARHSCMKGDECPYDHELSKYPCNNYASNGSCSRGSECLFSHEIPANSCPVTSNPNASKYDLMAAQNTVAGKGGSAPISKVTKPEQKFLSPPNNSNSSKHMDNHVVLHQKVDPKFCSASKPPGQSAEQPAAKPVARIGGQPPKGVSFLLNKGTSLGDTNKKKREGSSTRTPNGGGGVGCNEIPKGPGGISELNKISEVAAPRKPRGINFLSFGQPSADDSSGKIFSNLLAKSTNLASHLNEKVHGTRLTVPQHVNSSSISKGTTNLHSSKGDSAFSFAKESPSTSELQETVGTPSLYYGIWNQSTTGQNANLCSSFKRSLLSNTPSSVQKAVQSMLSFAAKLESEVKVGSSLHQR